MFGGVCGPLGWTGWVVMAVVWTGLIALVVWAIARLFPQRPTPPPPSQGTGPLAASEFGDWPGHGYRAGDASQGTDVTTSGGRR
jgi:hypothetical protein